MTTIYINNDNLKLFKVIFIFHTIMSLFENIRDGKEEAVIIYKDKYVNAFEYKYPEAPIH